MRWNRKALSRLSSVIHVMRLPSSAIRNSMPSLFMAHMVSDWYQCVNGAYLVIFLIAAASAAVPCVCDGSMQVRLCHRVGDCDIPLLLLLLLL